MIDAGGYIPLYRKIMEESFYKDPQLFKKNVSLKLKDSDIREAIELVNRAAGLNFVIDPRVIGIISDINLRNVSVASALKIILSANSPNQLPLGLELNLLEREEGFWVIL